MELTSQAFERNGKIPSRYTCQGNNTNPPLEWAEVPEGTKSFALIIDDPDAVPVAGFTWIHWLVKDIPASTLKIYENSVLGTQLKNSFGREAYGGPCPPDGKHRYFFKLYALDVEKLQASTSKEVYEQVEAHKIEKAVLMGTYVKQ
ncbi:MAG: YbhB/YbcL family Raf kinase inhibitor-like protein [Nanoarchaeota archaeon]|nr:YbhB/YbcL family Raf kinase inhibitor-like protein [Nanoarchaeota archaeon]